MPISPYGAERKSKSIVRGRAVLCFRQFFTFTSCGHSFFSFCLQMLSIKQEKPEVKFAECDVCGISAALTKGWWTQCKTPECGGRIVFPVCPRNMKYYRSICKNEVVYYRQEVNIDACICHYCDEPYNTTKSIIEVRCGQLVYKATHKKEPKEEIKDLIELVGLARMEKYAQQEKAEELQKENEELKKETKAMGALVMEMERTRATQEVELKTLRNLVDKMTLTATPSEAPRDQEAVGSEDLAPPPAKRGRRKSSVDEVAAEPQIALRRSKRRSAPKFK